MQVMAMRDMARYLPSATRKLRALEKPSKKTAVVIVGKVKRASMWETAGTGDVRTARNHFSWLERRAPLVLNRASDRLVSQLREPCARWILFFELAERNKDAVGQYSLEQKKKIVISSAERSNVLGTHRSNDAQGEERLRADGKMFQALI